MEGKPGTSPGRLRSKGPSRKKRPVRIPSDAKAAGRKWDKLNVAPETLAGRAWLSLDAIAPGDTKPPRIGPGPRPGTHTVCYYNQDSGQWDNCYVVPD
jgi:hypothetical protein